MKNTERLEIKGRRIVKRHLSDKDFEVYQGVYRRIESRLKQLYPIAVKEYEEKVKSGEWEPVDEKDKHSVLMEHLYFIGEEIDGWGRGKLGKIYRKEDLHMMHLYTCKKCRDRFHKKIGYREP